jgi:nucleotide-binding universal stress UspA family protein
MHILETKDRVTVVTVGDVPVDDVMALLHRHGVPGEHIVRPSDRAGVARTILAACSEVGAGLLVMGAYGHNRIMEEIFGGVTHDIMQDAPLPVLMSH